MKQNNKKSKRSFLSKYILVYTVGQVILLMFMVQNFVWLSGQLLRDQHVQIIQSKSDGLVEHYHLGGEESLTEILAYRLKRNTNQDAVYLLTDENFNPIMGNVKNWPVEVPKDSEWGEVDWKEKEDFIELNYYNRTLEDGRHLLIGLTNSYIEYYGIRLRLISLAILVATILVGFLLGWFLYHQLQRRFSLIEETCQQISKGQLSTRMPLNDKGDEIDRLAQTINSMLDKIEKLMGGIQHVTNNIAHDLRTPLTRVRGRLDLLQSKLKNDEHRNEIEASLRDMDDLLSTFQSLLNISRMESGQIKRDFTSIHLDQLCEDVIELYEPIAEEKQQHIAFTQASNNGLIGDKDLLFQCIANILDNAIKYSPNDSTIQVSITRSSQGLVLSIHDQGEGIAPQEFTKVFDRFYRVETSRHLKGNGLGLSVVAAIVELHNAKIELENDKGLLVRLTFPSI